MTTKTIDKKETNKEQTENELSHSMVHYLLTIHKLKENRGFARVTDIAKDLDLTKGSVSTMLNNLKKRGLIEEEDECKFVILTKEGHDEVHRILSSRTLLFYSLKDFVGVDEETADRDSCQMEHLMSPKTSEKFFNFMKTLACSCEELEKKVSYQSPFSLKQRSIYVHTIQQMNSFINKKVIAIYQIIISFSLLVLSFSVRSQEDLLSYCFEQNVSLNRVKSELDFLLLPREKVIFREADHCIDIVSSSDRGKLLEKFLRKRYTLLGDSSSSVGGDSLNLEHCRIDFITTKQKKRDSQNAAIGLKTNVSASNQVSTESSTTQLLLSFGRPGSIDIAGESLELECRKGATGWYQLIFKKKSGNGSIQSEASLKSGETLNLGGIVKDLDDKSKTLGIPQSSINTTQGSEEIKYELKILEER